jgi:hypothetical protein
MNNLIKQIFPQMTGKFILIRVLEIVIFIALLRKLPMAYPLKVLTISMIFGLYTLINSKLNWARALKSSLYIALVLFLIKYMLDFLGKWGTAGVILGMTILASWRLIKQRKMFMRGLRVIETEMFGKPLDRENWKGKKPKLRGW